MRKETMRGIWHSPELKPKAAIQSPRKTTTSTPNIISGRCRRRERNRRDLMSDAGTPKPANIPKRIGVACVLAREGARSFVLTVARHRHSADCVDSVGHQRKCSGRSSPTVARAPRNGIARPENEPTKLLPQINLVDTLA